MGPCKLAARRCTCAQVLDLGGTSNPAMDASGLLGMPRLSRLVVPPAAVDPKVLRMLRRRGTGRRAPPLGDAFGLVDVQLVGASPAGPGAAGWMGVRRPAHGGLWRLGRGMLRAVRQLVLS